MRTWRPGGRTAALLLLSLALAPAADASFPGRNGKLAVSVEGCGLHTFDSPRYIRAYSASGRKLGRLTGCDADRYGPDWSPGGRRLAVAQEKPSTRFHLVTMRADGRHRRRVAGEPSFLYGPSFAPGGRRLLFSHDDVLRISPIGRGKPRTLSPGLCDRCELYDPRWSPRGGRIAVRGVGGELWLVSSRTSKPVRRLTTDGLDADWAPHGKRLVYSSIPSQPDEQTGDVTGGDLYVVGADGNGLRRLVETDRVAAMQPTWSPDGRWIAYVQLDYSGLGSPVATLWRVRSGGGAPRQIAKLPSIAETEGDYRTPQISWQPLPRRR